MKREERQALLKEYMRLPAGRLYQQRREELKARLLEEPEETVRTVCELLEPYPGKGEVIWLIELLGAIGYPQNVVTIPFLVRELGNSYHPCWFKAGEVLQGVPAEVLVPHLVAAMLVPGPPYHFPGEEIAEGEEEERWMYSSYYEWYEDVLNIGTFIYNSVKLEKSALCACAGVMYYLCVWELENGRRLERELGARERKALGKKGPSLLGIHMWLLALERAGVQPWMAPALVEVARRYPQAKGAEVARRLLKRLPKEELRPYRRLLERAGLGALVETSYLDLGDSRAVELRGGVEEDGRLIGEWETIGELKPLAEVGFPGNREVLMGLLGEAEEAVRWQGASRVLQRVPAEELVPYVVEALQEPGGPDRGEREEESYGRWVRRREGIGRWLADEETEREVVQGCREVVYYWLTWQLEELRRKELDPLAREEGKRERAWSGERLSPDLAGWLRVLERAGVESWMAPALVEVVRRYPQREEGEVARRLLGGLPKEELRPYRLILEQSGMGELGN